LISREATHPLLRSLSVAEVNRCVFLVQVFCGQKFIKYNQILQKNPSVWFVLVCLISREATHEFRSLSVAEVNRCVFLVQVSCGQKYIKYNQIQSNPSKILLFYLCLFVRFLAKRLFFYAGHWVFGHWAKSKWVVTTTKTHAQKHVRRRHVFKLFLLILWLWKKWRKEFRRRDENIMLSDSSFLWKTGTWEIPKIYNRRDASSRSSSIGVDCTVISFFLIV
jgi:hypothetical protein